MTPIEQDSNIEKVDTDSTRTSKPNSRRPGTAPRIPRPSWADVTEDAERNARQSPHCAGDYITTLRRVYEKVCAVNIDEATRPALETTKLLVEGLLAGAEMAEAMRLVNVPSRQTAAFPTLRQTTLPTMTSGRPAMMTYASVAHSNLGSAPRPFLGAKLTTVHFTRPFSSCITSVAVVCSKRGETSSPRTNKEKGRDGSFRCILPRAFPLRTLH